MYLWNTSIAHTRDDFLTLIDEEILFGAKYIFEIKSFRAE